MSDDVDTDEDGWQPLNVEPGRMHAVFPGEAYFSANPLALFADREDAEKWLAAKQAGGDDAELSDEAGILEADGISGWCWNNYKDAPGEPPASDVPDLQSELLELREKHEAELARYRHMAKTALEAQRPRSWEELDAAAAAVDLKLERGFKGRDRGRTAHLLTIVGVNAGAPLLDVRSPDAGDELADEMLRAAVGAAIPLLRDPAADRDHLARRIYAASGGHDWEGSPGHVKDAARACADVAIAAGADPRRLP